MLAAENSTTFNKKGEVNFQGVILILIHYYIIFTAVFGSHATKLEWEAC